MKKAPSDTHRRVSSHRCHLLYSRRNISSLKLSGSSTKKLQGELFALQYNKTTVAHKHRNQTHHLNFFWRIQSDWANLHIEKPRCPPVISIEVKEKWSFESKARKRSVYHFRFSPSKTTNATAGFHLRRKKWKKISFLETRKNGIGKIDFDFIIEAFEIHFEVQKCFHEEKPFLHGTIDHTTLLETEDCCSLKNLRCQRRLLPFEDNQL